MTGFAPCYLLYGHSPLLAFDISDRTWDTLDWHIVHSTVDLIALRAQKIVQRDRNLVVALAQQKVLRQKPWTTSTNDTQTNFRQMNLNWELGFSHMRCGWTLRLATKAC